MIDQASDNTVGGLAAAARDLISGNQNSGVYLSDVGTSDNVVEGDFIGTDVTGTTAFDSSGKPLGNKVADVWIEAAATDNTIGGTAAGAAQPHFGQRRRRGRDHRPGHDRHKWQRGRRRFYRHGRDRHDRV